MHLDSSRSHPVAELPIEATVDFAIKFTSRKLLQYSFTCKERNNPTFMPEKLAERQCIAYPKSLAGMLHE